MDMRTKKNKKYMKRRPAKQNGVCYHKDSLRSVLYVVSLQSVLLDLKNCFRPHTDT